MYLLIARNIIRNYEKLSRNYTRKRLEITTEKLYRVIFWDTHDHVISYPVISRNYCAVPSWGHDLFRPMEVEIFYFKHGLGPFGRKI